MNKCPMCGGETKIITTINKNPSIIIKKTSSLGPTMSDPLMSECIVCGFKQVYDNYIDDIDCQEPTSEELQELKDMILIPDKCGSCQQKATHSLMIDEVHEVPYCGFEFCRDRILKGYNDNSQ